MTDGKKITFIGSALMTKETKKIEVVPYDPNWPEQFENEARIIKEALGDKLFSPSSRWFYFNPWISCKA